MFKNYFKIALRNFRKYKAYSVINIAGLGIGMACCILILLWVQDELSFDRFHENPDQIYRVNSDNYGGGKITSSAGSPSLIGPTLIEDYPEVVNFTRLQSGWTGWYLHYGEKNFTQERLACADPSFFEIFDFPFIKGDPLTALKDRYSIVLTEALAKKCFGNDDPMGKVIQMSDTDLKVTGVIKDIPRNSHVQFDYIFPIINMTKWRESKLDSWEYTQFATYIEMQKNVDAAEFNQKIFGLVKKNHPESQLEVYLQPLKDIHLRSTQLNTWMVVYAGKGNITYVYIFSLIASCVLIVACINFINLATARSSTRAKEVGIRKVVGAYRRDLIRQFLGETILLSLFALLVAIFLVELMMPTFVVLSGKEISLDYSNNIQTLLGLLGIVVLTGIISGSYPALYLSSFHPVGAFKSITRIGSMRSGALRKILVIGQFSFAILLVIVTAVIFSQMRFIQNKDLGFDKENLIYFASYGDYGRNYEAAKSELLQNPNISNVCLAFPPSGGFGGTTDIDWAGKEPTDEIMMYSDMGDYDFLRTFDLQMAEGRFYSREFSTDTSNFVVNETAVKMMGLTAPIGKRLSYQGRSGTIIGVVKDYHGGSLHDPILPKVIELADGFFVCVRIRPESVSETIRFLEKKWKTFVPDHPFRYRFLDETIDDQYKTELRIGKIFRYFTGLAVFISCLGLFGLTSFTAERRTKEIGIRKVLGAKVAAIIILLSKEFTKWVLLANIIAWPIAYFAANMWLQGFAYRIDLGWELFLLSTCLALVIAVLTVGYQAIKAAVANPVEALRYE
jgi:ABC-type antimicrobial peptide transport system permease subunit